MRAAIEETDRRRAIQRRLQRGARDHAGDDRQGHLGHRRVPAVRVEGPALAAPAQRGTRGTMPPAEIEKHDRRARGGDAGRGRGAALRVRGQAARRDPRPEAPARQASQRMTRAAHAAEPTRGWPRSGVASGRGAPMGSTRLRRDMLEVVRVAMDRQSIEKQDFPIGRRGYDPEPRSTRHLESTRRRGSRSSSAPRASQRVRSLDRPASRCARSSRRPRRAPPRFSARPRRRRARSAPRPPARHRPRVSRRRPRHATTSARSPSRRRRCCSGSTRSRPS